MTAKKAPAKKATGTRAKYPPVRADIQFLSARELKDLLANSGLNAADLDNPLAAEDPAAALAALAWIITRREHPDCTFDEAWDIPLILDDVPVDPTNASS